MEKFLVKKRIPTSALLSEANRSKLDKLKELNHIKSISEGIRLSVADWLNKPEQAQRLKDKSQKKITDYNHKGEN